MPVILVFSLSKNQGSAQGFSSCGCWLCSPCSRGSAHQLVPEELLPALVAMRSSCRWHCSSTWLHRFSVRTADMQRDSSCPRTTGTPPPGSAWSSACMWSWETFPADLVKSPVAAKEAADELVSCKTNWKCLNRGERKKKRLILGKIDYGSTTIMGRVVW